MISMKISFPGKNLDPAGTYKNYMREQLNKVYPWLTVDGFDGPVTETSYQNLAPYEYLRFAPNTAKYNVSRVIGNQSRYAIPERYVPTYDLANDFQLAMKKLHDYANLVRINEKPDYDYINMFGLPVRDCGTYYQVGNTIVPKAKGYPVFRGLSNRQLVSIREVITQVNNYSFVI